MSLFKLLVSFTFAIVFGALTAYFAGMSPWVGVCAAMALDAVWSMHDD